MSCGVAVVKRLPVHHHSAKYKSFGIILLKPVLGGGGGETTVAQPITGHVQTQFEFAIFIFVTYHNLITSGNSYVDSRS